jgi:hypothetical protein
MADAWAPGYIKRLPFIRRFLFNCSYRLNSIKHKCRLVLSGKQSVAEFLVSYELVRKSRIMDLAAELHLDSRAKLGKDDWANQWFTLYLEEARGRYQASASVGNVRRWHGPISSRADSSFTGSSAGTWICSRMRGRTGPPNICSLCSTKWMRSATKWSGVKPRELNQYAPLMPHASANF